MLTYISLRGLYDPLGLNLGFPICIKGVNCGAIGAIDEDGVFGDPVFCSPGVCGAGTSAIAKEM